MTEGSILYDSNRSSLEGGELDSVSFFTQLARRDPHAATSLDTNNQVPELNDGVSGTDNNVLDVNIEVTAQGLRVVFQTRMVISLNQRLTEMQQQLSKWMFEMKQALASVRCHARGYWRTACQLPVSGVQEPD